MATLGTAKPNTRKRHKGNRRVSPLKPGLLGMRNWTTAQIRAASYSKAKRKRLIWSTVILALMVVWGGLWLGGFIPDIQARANRAVKTRLVSMGFVVRHVDVLGQGQISQSQVRAALGVRPGDFLFDMNINTAQRRIQNLSWVETAMVRRLWPNRIVVQINERRPYALWQADQKLNVIDKAGVVITDASPSRYSNLPLVVGVGANMQVQSFVEMIEHKADHRLADYSGVYVGHRRWDLVAEDGRRILLPASQPELALVRLSTYLKNHAGFHLDFDRIDLRNPDRVYFIPASKPEISADMIRM